MRSGFGRNEVMQVTSAKDSADLLRDLPSRIGEPDIRFYQEGIKRGGTVIVVETADAKAQAGGDDHEQVQHGRRRRPYD